MASADKRKAMSSAQRTRVDGDAKLNIVRRIVENPSCRQDIMAKFDLGRSTVDAWVAAYKKDKVAFEEHCKGTVGKARKPVKSDILETAVLRWSRLVRHKKYGGSSR